MLQKNTIGEGWPRSSRPHTVLLDATEARTAARAVVRFTVKR